MAGAPKKLSENTVAFSYRTNAETWRVFTSLAKLKGETPTDIFRAREKSYIEENGELLRSVFKDLQNIITKDAHINKDHPADGAIVVGKFNTDTYRDVDTKIAALESEHGTTPNAETVAAIRDVEEGRFERFESKEEFYKDLGLL
jgi:hypothetical protein